MAQLTTPTTITIEQCAPFFAAPDSAVNGAAEPPVPSSCTFTDSVASGQTPPRLPVTTNLTATTAVKSGLLGAYLFQTGWQSQYGSDITLHPGTTYVAYDPLTGLNWAFARFDYNGAGPSGSDGPGVGMQDGGNTGYFYQLPAPGSPSSAAGGWVMIGNAGAPFCFSRSFVPSDVIGIWGLSDDPLAPLRQQRQPWSRQGGLSPRGWSRRLAALGGRFEGRGFGQVKPSEVVLGGDPTGDIPEIAWSSWGGPEASGTGTSFYVARRGASERSGRSVKGAKARWGNPRTPVRGSGSRPSDSPSNQNGACQAV